MNGGCAWLIAGVRRRGAGCATVPGVNPMLNRIGVKLDEWKVRNNLMPIHRRRFRIEEAFAGDMPMTADGEFGPMHREIMAERSEERRVGKECRSRWSPY